MSAVATPLILTPAKDQEQETLLGGRTSLMGEVFRERVKVLYQKLSESIGQNPEEFHQDHSKLERECFTTITRTGL